MKNYTSLKYIAFGDSITYGVDHRKEYKKMPHPYPELVAAALGFAEVKNLGVSGATLVTGRKNRACMTERMLAVKDEADVVSVLLGVNDYADGSPLGTPEDTDTTTVYGALDTALRYLTETYPDAFIFIMTPYEARICGVWHTVKNSAGYTLSEVAEGIFTVAKRYSVPVLDLFSDGGFAEEIAMPYSDGIHPTPDFVEKRTAPDIIKFLNDRLSAFLSKDGV